MVTTLKCSDQVKKELDAIKSKTGSTTYSEAISHLTKYREWISEQSVVSSDVAPLQRAQFESFSVYCPVCESRLLDLRLSEFQTPDEGLLSQMWVPCPTCTQNDPTKDGASPEDRVNRLTPELVAVREPEDYDPEKARQVLIDSWEQQLIEASDYETVRHIGRLGLALANEAGWQWIPPLHPWDEHDRLHELLEPLRLMIDATYEIEPSVQPPEAGCGGDIGHHYHLAANGAGEDFETQVTELIGQFEQACDRMAVSPERLHCPRSREDVIGVGFA